MCTWHTVRQLSKFTAVQLREVHPAATLKHLACMLAMKQTINAYSQHPQSELIPRTSELYVDVLSAQKPAVQFPI
jgi:hypothetical protein